jgi:hypothetical protein
LCKVIKNHEAVFISGKGITHEYLIKAVAQQMGSAHEANGLEPALVDMRQIFITGVEPYKQILAFDAELALQIAERVFDEAEKKIGFQRQRHSQNYGNLSVTLRIQLKQRLVGKLQLFNVHSHINEVDMLFEIFPETIAITIKKKGEVVKEVSIKHPTTLQSDTDIAILFSYCSYAKQYHIVIDGKAQDDGVKCDIGWLHAGDFSGKAIEGYKDFVEGGILLHGRLLSPRECLEILGLPPNLYGLLKPKEELQNDSVFPS